MFKNILKSKYITAAAVCVVIAAAIVTASVFVIADGNGSGASSDEAAVDTAVTATVETDVNETDGSSASSSVEATELESEVSDGGESEPSVSSVQSPSDSYDSDGSSALSSQSSQKSSSGSSHSSTEVCTVDGVDYYVGDTVTYLYRLTSPEKLINFQAYITYDSDHLTVSSAKLKGDANTSSIINYTSTKGLIQFNGSEISSGYDYSGGGDFLKVTYTVKAAGSASTKFVWQVATGFDSDKAYVSNGAPASGLKITKTLS